MNTHVRTEDHAEVDDDSEATITDEECSGQKIPDGVDREVFEALPLEIRNEISAQRARDAHRETSRDRSSEEKKIASSHESKTNESEAAIRCEKYRVEDVPDGVDREVFAALPLEIRNEIKAQRARDAHRETSRDRSSEENKIASTHGFKTNESTSQRKRLRDDEEKEVSNNAESAGGGFKRRARSRNRTTARFERINLSRIFVDDQGALYVRDDEESSRYRRLMQNKDLVRSDLGGISHHFEKCYPSVFGFNATYAWITRRSRSNRKLPRTLKPFRGDPKKDIFILIKNGGCRALLDKKKHDEFQYDLRSHDILPFWRSSDTAPNVRVIVGLYTDCRAIDATSCRLEEIVEEGSGVEYASLSGQRLNVLDLYSGAGGMSLGLERAGLNVRWAVDQCVYVADCYERVHPDTFMFVRDAQLFHSHLSKHFRDRKRNKLRLRTEETNEGIVDFDDDSYVNIDKTQIHMIHSSPPCTSHSGANSRRNVEAETF
eukprot:g417.t1